MTQKTFTLLSIVFIGLSTATAQTDFNRTINLEFEKEVDSYLNYSVPAITVKNLIQIKDDVILLDARETKEYEVSHIPGARYVGFDDFDDSVLSDIDKDNRIVVYCSIGFRSEKIGEKLKKLGLVEEKEEEEPDISWAETKKLTRKIAKGTQEETTGGQRIC